MSLSKEYGYVNVMKRKNNWKKVTTYTDDLAYVKVLPEL